MTSMCRVDARHPRLKFQAEYRSNAGDVYTIPTDD